MQAHARSTARGAGRWAAIGLVVVLAAACGGDDSGGANGSDGDTDAAADGGDDGGDHGFGEALAEALPTGGGGTLVFDGEEITIDSVTCVLDDETFDVGTVSDSGHRVFVSRSDPVNDVAAQVLDPDFVQWFPDGVSGDEAERDGSSFQSDTTPYPNNVDDRIVEVSLTGDCP